MGKIIMEKQDNLITKQELLERLDKEGIRITSRTLTYYMDLGLIPKGTRKYIKGVRGSVSFFKENVLLMIKGIKKMTDPRAVKNIVTGIVTMLSLKLKEVVKFKNLIYDYNEAELIQYFSVINPEIPTGYKRGYFEFINERSKLSQVIIHYAHAEAGLFWESESWGLSDEPTDNLYTGPSDPDRPLLPDIYPMKDNGKIVEIQIRIPREDSKNRVFYIVVTYSKRGIEIKEPKGGDSMIVEK